MYLDNLTSQEVNQNYSLLHSVLGVYASDHQMTLHCRIHCQVINLELSTGVPMVYIYTEGKFIRRGSPLGSTKAGVYALSEVSSIIIILSSFLVFSPSL